MSVFSETYARLANDAYRDKSEQPRIDTAPFRVIRTIDKASGYHGVIYKNTETNELVVAHRGTEFEGDTLRDLMQADGQMALLALNQQLDGAREAVELAMALAKHGDKNGLQVQVTVTGHSLGGALAQMTAAEYGLRGETFNAYGAAGLHDTPAGGNQVVNHVRATDIVSAAGRHFGSVRVYALEQDAALLLHNGALPDRQSPVEFWKDVYALAPGKTHAIEQFHGGNRDAAFVADYGPQSIIRPENVARYEQNRAQFDAYRSDIYDTALALRYGLGASAMTSPHMSMLHLNLGASYLAHKTIGAFDRNEELRALQKEAAGPDYGWRGPPADRSVRPHSGPPLQSASGEESEYGLRLKALEEKYGLQRGEAATSTTQAMRRDADPNFLQNDPVRKPLSPNATVHELFERLSTAALTRDDAGMRAVGQAYLQSDAGQHWLLQGREYVQHLRAQEQQAELEAQQRQAQETQIRSGPVMSR